MSNVCLVTIELLMAQPIFSILFRGGSPEGEGSPKSARFGVITRFAWLPIPLFLGAIFILWFVESHGTVHEPPYLLAILNFIFRTAIGGFIAYLAARSFVRNGSLPLLGLGCGMLFLGVSSVVSGLTIHYGQINLALTVYNSAVWFSGACHLGAAIASMAAGACIIRNPRLVVSLAYALILLVLALLAFAAFEGLTPVYFVQGEGPTIFRQAILFSAAGMFGLAALMVTIKSRRRYWAFGQWYAMALALMGTGIVGFMFASEVGGFIGWMGRSAQYLGGVYMLIAVMVAARESGEWDTILQDALEHSEERFRTLAEATFEGVLISEDGAITDANDQAAQILGYTPEELLGRPTTFFIPDDEARVMERVASGTNYPIEQSITRNDGSEAKAEIHGRFLERRGRRVCFLAVRDITERKKQEQALFEANKRVVETLECISDGFVLLDRDWNYAYVNPAAAIALQTTQEELTGKNFWERWPGIKHLMSGTELPKCMNERRPVHYEEYYGPLDGWYSCHGYPSPDGISLFFANITEQKRSERALRELTEANERNHARLTAIVNQMTEGLVTFDPQGRLLDMNPAALEIHGFASVESIRRDLEDLTDVFELFDLEGNRLPPGDWPIGRVLQGETLRACEVRVRRIDTGKTWIGSYGGTPVYDEDGAMAFAIVTLRDVTAQRTAEQALEKSRDELEKRVAERTLELQNRADQLARLASELTLTEQRERGRLAQVLHDHLQQLLVSAKYSLTLLARNKPVEIQDGLGGIEHLLNESIEASRLLTVELAPPILQEGGLGDGLQWLARWAKQRFGLEVSLTIDEEAVAGREDVRILLFQAVRELLMNVAKYANVSEVSIELARHGKKQLRVTVEDHGIGFDPDLVSSGSDKVTGGFGLFSIRERLGFFGGSFQIESQDGQGARITLIAPHGEPAADSAEVDRSPLHPPLDQGGEPQPASAGQTSGDRIRLMLVDDHAVMRQGMSSLLGVEEDIEIVGEASDGQDAVERAREVQPDVILMDFSMPRLDGVQATQIIHAELPHIQILGLSMYEEADRAEAMTKAGAVGYVTKSGESDVLLSAIRQAAANRVRQES